MLWLTLEIRDQHLNTGIGAHLVNLTCSLCVEPGTAVFKIVTCHTGHRGITQTHNLNIFSDFEGLSVINCSGFTSRNIAEIAAAGAFGTANKVGCLAVFPTLVDIRTASFLTHCMKPLAPGQFLHFIVFRPHNGFGLNPVRLLLDGNLSIASLDAQQLAAFRLNAHVCCSF